MFVSKQVSFSKYSSDEDVFLGIWQPWKIRGQKDRGIGNLLDYLFCDMEPFLTVSFSLPRGLTQVKLTSKWLCRRQKVTAKEGCKSAIIFSSSYGFGFIGLMFRDWLVGRIPRVAHSHDDMLGRSIQMNSRPRCLATSKGILSRLFWKSRYNELFPD